MSSRNFFLLLIGSTMAVFSTFCFFVNLLDKRIPEFLMFDSSMEGDDYIGKRVAQIRVFDPNGDAMSLLSLSGELPFILSPIYTACPGSCSAITQQLIAVVDEMNGVGSDFMVVTFSFDQSDTPEELSRFRERWNLDEKSWKIVSADSAAIKQLLGSIGFWVDKIEETGQFNHANFLTVVSKDGIITKNVYGLWPNKFYLESGLQEARKPLFLLTGQEKFVSMFYYFDPITERYKVSWGATGVCVTTFWLVVCSAVLISFRMKRHSLTP